MKELVEHTDYRVSCKLNISSHLEVSIWCGMCNKHFRLNQKEGACGNTVVMISNWTSHIKKCIEQSKKVYEMRKQSTIFKCHMYRHGHLKKSQVNAVHQVTVLIITNRKNPAINMKVLKIKMILQLRASLLNK